jgi:hypothetical protein
MTVDEARAALGIEPNTSADEIRAAYKRAALWCHPDKNPGNRVAEETFKRVSEAYRVLSGSERATKMPETQADQQRRPPSPPPQEHRPSPTRAPPRPGEKDAFVAVRNAFVALLVAAAFFVVVLGASASGRQRAGPTPTPAPRASSPASTKADVTAVARRAPLLTAGFVGTCRVRRELLYGDSFPAYCLTVRVINDSNEHIRSIYLDVVLRERSSGERHPLLSSSTLWFPVSLAPRTNTSIDVQGVTLKRIGEADVLVEKVESAF